MERNELCYEIEKLPASEQQTKVSLLACEMVNKMEEMEKNLWATREELHEKKQRIDTLLKRLEIQADGTDRIDILEMHIQNIEFELRQAKKEHRLQKSPVVRALRDKLGRYEKALQQINGGDIDPIKTAGDALMSLPTIRKVDDPDDYYTEPPDGSHGMQGVPGR